MNLLQKRVTEMVIVENQIQESLEQLPREIQNNSEVAEVIKRFQTMVNDHQQALQESQQIIGGSEPNSTSIIAPVIMTITLLDKEDKHTVSKAVQAVSTMFNHAAFGYTILHTIAHLFNSGGYVEGNIAALAEEHRRSYTDASQTIYQLIPDIVIGEVGKDGECTCTCPACSLGICLCWHGHDDSLMVLPSEGIMMRSPKANSAALEAGLRQGDIILTADGNKLPTYWAINDVIRKREPGEGVRLRVKRGLDEPLEIIVTLPI